MNEYNKNKLIFNSLRLRNSSTHLGLQKKYCTEQKSIKSVCKKSGKYL